MFRLFFRIVSFRILSFIISFYELLSRSCVYYMCGHVCAHTCVIALRYVEQTSHTSWFLLIEKLVCVMQIFFIGKVSGDRVSILCTSILSENVLTIFTVRGVKRLRQKLVFYYFIVRKRYFNRR